MAPAFRSNSGVSLATRATPRSAQQLRLCLGELLVAQDPRGLECSELLQLLRDALRRLKVPRLSGRRPLRRCPSTKLIDEDSRRTSRWCGGFGEASARDAGSKCGEILLP